MSDIKPPKLSDTFLELTRTTIEFVALQALWKPLLDAAPKGDGSPVMVLPGLGGDDMTTKPLRKFLREIGYYTHGWRNGRNIGPNEKTIEHLRDRLHELHKQHGKKITLIGHSLGGVFAREMAREYPDMVERVITLGSPFGAGAHPDSTVRGIRTIMEVLHPKSALMDAEAMHDVLLTPPPVPTTSLYTRNDGIVNWKTCINPEADDTENVEIIASHCGLVMNPVSLLVIADRLVQDSDNWEPFDKANYPGVWFHSQDKHEEFTPDHPPAANDNNEGPKLF